MNELLRQKIKYLLSIIIFLSVIVILSFTPDLGFIRYNYLTISIVSIVVIIAAIKNGWFVGMLCGLAFGLCSFFVANDYDMNPLDQIYQNIFIAIVPRVFLGISSAIVFRMINKIFKMQWLSAMITSIICFAAMIAIIFSMAFVLEWSVLVNIYNETNPLYLFYQYAQYSTLIETTVITLMVGIFVLINEYLIKWQIQE